MAEGVFLATIEELCNSLRTSLTQEFRTSVASLRGNLERLAAENSELRAKYCHGDEDTKQAATSVLRRVDENQSPELTSSLADGGTQAWQAPTSLFRSIDEPDDMQSPELTSSIAEGGTQAWETSLEQARDEQAARHRSTSLEQASGLLETRAEAWNKTEGVEEHKSLQTDSEKPRGDREDDGEEDKAEEQEGDWTGNDQSPVRFHATPMVQSESPRPQRPSLKPSLKRVSVNIVSEPEMPDVSSGNQSRAKLAAFVPPGSIAEDQDEDEAEDEERDEGFGRFTSGESDDEDDESYQLAEAWDYQNRTSTVSRRSARGQVTLTDVRKGPEHIVSDDENIKRSRLDVFRAFLEARVLLMPFSRPHIAWESLGCFLLLYDLTVVPLAIFEPEETTFTEIMTWMVRIFWSLDVCISFLTGYIDNEGITIMSLPKIAKHYISAQFPLDVVVVLFDWLDAIIGVRATGVMKGGRILRIMRLVRVRKARQLWFQLSEYVNADRMVVFMRTCKNLGFLFILLHFLACFWWAVGLLGADSGASWIDGMTELTIEEKYLRSFHMGLANFYGNQVDHPRNQLERLYSLILLFSSFMFQIWMVSSVTTAMTHLEIVSSKRSSMFSALDRFLTLHHVSRELRLKVHRSARHSLLTNDRHTSEENVELLQLISNPLMARLHVEMYAPVLRVCPVLRCLMLTNSGNVRQICHTAISVDHVNKDDVIFCELEKPLVPKVRFILNDGELQYTSKSQGSSVDVCGLNWLSEAVLWTTDWIHKGTARALDDAQILCLDAEAFREIMAPFDGEQARKYARMYVNNLNGTGTFSDIGSYDTILGRMLEGVFPLIWEKVSHEFQVDPDGSGKLRRPSARGRGSALFYLRESTRSPQGSPQGSTRPEVTTARKSVVPAMTQAATDLLN